MPIILKKSVYCFSSEDPTFPARNLCENDKTARWKCQNPGEKLAFVVLKFDKPCLITNITIGNEHSFSIGVSVGNSKQEPPVYQELLLSSSFMTEKDVRNGLNPNRIRSFENSSFVQSVVSQKWDLLKITCTQPLSSRKQFGIAFITIYSSDKDDNEEKAQPMFSNTSLKEVKKEEKYHLKKPSPTAAKIGKFAFRNSSSDDDDEDASPFKQWKMKKDAKASGTTPLANIKSEPKTATLTRKRIHSSSDSSGDDRKSKLKVKQDRNRMKGLMYDSDDDAPNERLQKKLDLDRTLKEKEKERKKTLKNPVKSSPNMKYASLFDLSKTKDVSPPSENKASTSFSPQILPTSTSSKPKKERLYKPFGKLLDGVTFVMSGYQNPERGNLRQKAIDMGARYKGDWDDSCTHLICAFANTPKFNQVKGKGKIVNKKWIESCFSEQKRLPWRRFAVDRNDKDASESEEEIHCEWKKSKPLPDSDSDGDMVVVDKRASKKSPLKSIEKKEDIKIEEKVKCVDIDDQKENLSIEIDSDSSVDITQVECEAFKNKVFYLNSDLPASTLIKFKHLIKYMLGSITNDVSKANYIVTKSGKNLPQNKGLAEVIKDTWVEECHELQALLPTTRYKL